MKRKTPIKHKVRSHTREDKQIKSYLHGYGQKPKLAKPKISSLIAAKKSKLKSEWNKKLSSDEVMDFEVEAIDNEGETFYLNISKSAEDEDWFSTDSSRYHGYMTPEDVLSAIRGDYEEAWITEIEGEAEEEFIS